MKQYYCPHCGDKRHHEVDATTKENSFGWTSIIFCCITCNMIFEVWEWPEKVKATEIPLEDTYNSGSFLLIRWKTAKGDKNGKL